MMKLPEIASEPVGYLIVEEAARVRSRFQINYHGIDRRPPFYAPDDQIRLSIGEPLVKDRRLYHALETYFDCISKPIPFLNDYQMANGLLETLLAFGHSLELVYAEVLSAGEALPAIDSLAEASTPGPYSYGLDVSWLSATHSAIFQPGIVHSWSAERPGRPEWREKLNRWGLLEDVRDAIKLREEYLQIYPHPPFFLFRVSGWKENPEATVRLGGMPKIISDNQDT